MNINSKIKRFFHVFSTTPRTTVCGQGSNHNLKLLYFKIHLDRFFSFSSLCQSNVFGHQMKESETCELIQNFAVCEFINLKRKPV